MRLCTIIATYNGEKYLKEQLETIDKQIGDFKNTLVVTDDGSTDKTLEIVENFQADNVEIRIVENEGKRAGSATANFFRALRKINLNEYDYIAFSDQDDIWLSDKLSRAIDLLKLNDCYLSNLTLYYEGETPSKIMVRATNPTKFDYIFQGGSAGCTYVLRTKCMQSVLEAIKDIPLDILKKYSHDWIIYTISRSYGYSWARDSESRILYRQHASNLHGATIGFSGVIKRLRLIASKWYLDNLKFNVKLLTLNSSEEKIVFDYFSKHSNVLKFKFFLVSKALILRRDRIESFSLFLYLFIFVWIV